MYKEQYVFELFDAFLKHKKELKKAFNVKKDT